MDTDQIESRMAWLDEQRVKDADTIRNLTKTIEALEASQAKLAKQVQAISEENSRIAAQAARITQMDDALVKHRKEVIKQLEIAEARRTEKELHLEALRKTDQKTTSKQIEKLRSDLSRINEIDERVDARREEQVRLNREVDTLTKKYDKVETAFHEILGQFKGIQESHQKEHKHIGEIDAGLGDVKRRAAGARTELEGLADDVRRVDLNLSEAAAAEEERRQAQAVFFERQELKLVEFDKAWAAWEERFKAFENEAAAINEKIISYDETFRAARSIQETLGGVMERMERRMTEVSEMQRLAEERIKQEWNSVQAEDHKRWNTFKLTNDEQWRDHDRAHLKLDETVASLQQALSAATQSLASMREIDEGRVRELVAMIRQWASEVERAKR
jgi:chromosome segregation ATPase